MDEANLRSSLNRDSKREFKVVEFTIEAVDGVREVGEDLRSEWVVGGIDLSLEAR